MTTNLTIQFLKPILPCLSMVIPLSRPSSLRDTPVIRAANRVRR